MSNPVPNMLALTSIADGSERLAAPIRNNFSDTQTAVNALITAVSGGTAGQVLQAADGSDVQWATLLQLVDTSQKYKLQFGSSAGTTDASGLLAVTFPVAFATACTVVVAINGDTTASNAAGYGVRNSTVSTTGFSYVTPVNLSPYRVNWLAIGY